MQNRRTFLKQMTSAAAAYGLVSWPFETFAADEFVKITVLHTNDVHSHIDPFPDNDPKYPGLGGVAYRHALINKIREQEKNVLLLDAGDIFQGTPYFNMFGGELEMKLMSRMQYDAGTIGNHDFDNGIEGLVKQMPHLNFPLLNTNYDVSKTLLNGKLHPYKVFEKENVRIGVFGIGVDLNGLVEKKMWQELIYNDPIESAAVTSHILKKKEKCDLIICLSHLGFKYPDERPSDVVLAKQSLNIDLIIGGHSHTMIETPYEYFNRDGKSVWVAQVGWAGVRLGKIDFYFEKKTGKFLTSATTVKVSNKAIG
jgi:5'-nucleotidase